MTLRIVSDNHEPDGVLYCRHSAGCRRPATILVSFLGKHYLPSCDPCARLTYEHHPDQTAFAPLAEYVDTFAAAKEAALATPEQVTQPANVQVRGSDVVDDEVLRRIWIDQVIYCRLHWWEMQGRLTPADQRLNAIGGLWYPACADCVARYDPAQVEVAPMSEENTAWELEMADEYAKSKRWAKPRPPMRRRTKILWWTVPAGVLALGIMMVSIASTMMNNFLTAADNDRLPVGANPPDVGALKGWGIFFIVVSSLVLAGAFIAYIAYLVSEATSVPAGQLRVPKATHQQCPAASPGIAVGQLATTAALVGAEALWHHQIRQRQARARDSVLGIAPLNNVHAGMKHATAILQQQSQSGSDGNMT